MMKRKEFQQWLDQFPEDTIIEVIVQDDPETFQSYGACYATVFEAAELDHFEFIDFNVDQFMAPTESYYKKRFLLLGSRT
jgi:hypothetical protein